MKTLRKIVIGGLLTVLAAFLFIQLVPYGHEHNNPPVARGPQWDSPETRALAEAACFDCHSNETNWGEWYTNVAPASWLVAHDVHEGRQVLNFSEWGSHPHTERAGELAESVREGWMPPSQYGLLHPEARLSPAQREQLVQGLIATARN